MSVISDAGIKPMLILQPNKLVTILIIISLVLYPLIAGAFVSEPLENTYSPEVGWVTPATTTQPDLDRSLAMSNDVVLIPQPIRKLTVEEKILRAFPNAPIMVEVARCESSLDPLADREDRNVDVGLFQINQVHLPRLAELGLDRRDIDDNIAYAKMLYDYNGLRDWYMSEHCWAKYL